MPSFTSTTTSLEPWKYFLSCLLITPLVHTIAHALQSEMRQWWSGLVSFSTEASNFLKHVSLDIFKHFEQTVHTSMSLSMNSCTRTMPGTHTMLGLTYFLVLAECYQCPVGWQQKLHSWRHCTEFSPPLLDADICSRSLICDVGFCWFQQSYWLLT